MCFHFSTYSLSLSLSLSFANWHKRNFFYSLTNALYPIIIVLCLKLFVLSSKTMLNCTVYNVNPRDSLLDHVDSHKFLSQFINNLSCFFNPMGKYSKLRLVCHYVNGNFTAVLIYILFPLSLSLSFYFLFTTFRFNSRQKTDDEFTFIRVYMIFENSTLTSFQRPLLCFSLSLENVAYFRTNWNEEQRDMKITL